MIDLPPGAVQYLPILAAEIQHHWPTAPLKSFMAAQVEQETCVSLKSKKCWSPYAELKTSREYGFGLGQLTVTAKFDNFKEAKKLDPSLHDWTWKNRYRADYQLRTLVLMDRGLFHKISWADNNCERLAMTLAAYNGGLGGLLSERKLCSKTPGCIASLWFDNIELTSNKSRVKYKGYGKSFYETNREYPINGLIVRRPRYVGFFKEQ